MPNKLANRVKMTVSGTPGTGSITLGSAVTGFVSFSTSGIVNGDTLPYVIEDGANWEIGVGTYSSTGPTLARTTVTASNNANNKINATANAIVMLSPLAADLQSTDTLTSGTLPVARGGTGVATLTAGQIPFGAGTSAFGSSSNLFWDSANSRLGVGIASPATRLHVAGNLRLDGADTNIAFHNGGTRFGYFRGISSETSIVADNTNLTLAALGANIIGLQTNGSERMRIDSSGRVGIGTTIPVANLQISNSLTGSVNTYAVIANSTTASDVTTASDLYRSGGGTASAAFTLNSLRHYYGLQGVFGSGSIVTNQLGFVAEATLTGATNNYGFYSGIAINPGSQTLSPATISTIASSGTTTTVVTTAAHGLTSTQAVTVAATANATELVSGVTCTILTVGTTDFTLIGAASNTVGVSFTATGAGTGTGTVRINQQGSGKAVTVVDTTTFTYTSTTGTYAAITASGSVTPNTRFNLFIAGTAPSYFATAVGIGTTNPRGRLEIANTTSSGMAITATADATDGKTWDLLVGGGNFAIRTLNDVYSAASTAFTIGRTGNLVTSHIWYTSNLERMRIDSSGQVGIGQTPTTGATLSLGKAITGATTAWSVRAGQSISSDVTANCRTIQLQPFTATSAFSLSNLFGVYYTFASAGSGSIVFNNFGFFNESTSIAATNNYGFYSSLSAPTSGGTASSTVSTVASSGTTTTVVTTAAHGLSTGQTVTVAATANATALVSGATVTILTVGTTDFTAIGAASNTVGLSFTATGAGTGTGTVTINQQGSGLSITVTNSTTFTYTSSSATYAAISTLTGTVTVSTRWNFYAAGSANNAFAGNSRFGGITAPVATVDVTGSVAATTTILSTGATSGIGYATGAGGAVTQATSRTTGVTLNKVSGQITLFSAAGSTAWQSFTVTNSAVAATDTIIVNQDNGADLYQIFVTNVAAGSFRITFATTGGTTTEQPVFNFAVIKAVAA